MSIPHRLNRHETGSSCFRLENELLFGYERAGGEQRGIHTNAVLLQ